MRSNGEYGALQLPVYLRRLTPSTKRSGEPILIKLGYLISIYILIQQFIQTINCFNEGRTGNLDGGKSTVDHEKEIHPGTL